MNMQLHYSDERFSETYLGALYAMERTIYEVYLSHRNLIDLEVIMVFDRLIQDYRKLEGGGEAPKMHRFAEPMHSVYSELKLTCDDLLEGVTITDEEKLEPLTFPELIGCLMKLRSSARFWNNSGGRQGYIEFIRDFL